MYTTSHEYFDEKPADAWKSDVVYFLGSPDDSVAGSSDYAEDPGTAAWEFNSWHIPRYFDAGHFSGATANMNFLGSPNPVTEALFNANFGLLPIGPIEAKLKSVKPIRGIVIGAFGEVSADTHSLVKEIAAQGGRKMYALMGVSPMEAAARIKKQLIDTIGTIAARGHAQLLLARLSALAPIAAQRGNTTNSNQQIISLNALARGYYRRSIGTRGGAQASAAD
ncbi:hypothetical protein T492DRAFT_899174 [Pavlovales sp. CCMP2436]|nr:hypothetical protein T492DRAFT_899174 [Pavlovales sp. CCMP2436]